MMRPSFAYLDLDGRAVLEGPDGSTRILSDILADPLLARRPPSAGELEAVRRRREQLRQLEIERPVPIERGDIVLYDTPGVGRPVFTIKTGVREDIRAIQAQACRDWVDQMAPPEVTGYLWAGREDPWTILGAAAAYEDPQRHSVILADPPPLADRNVIRGDFHTEPYGAYSLQGERPPSDTDLVGWAWRSLRAGDDAWLSLIATPSDHGGQCVRGWLMLRPASGSPRFVCEPARLQIEGSEPW